MASTIGGTTGVTFPDGTTQSTAATTPTAVANLSGGAAGKIPYQSAADTTGFSAVGTSGQPLVSGGTGAPAFRPYTLPASDGSNGQILQTNGSGALSFATPGGGSWIYLSTVTASNSATADVETTFDSTYDMYAIVAVGVRPATDNQAFSVRLKIGGSYQTANYAYVLPKISASASGTFSTTQATSADHIRIDDSAGNDVGEGINNIVMYIANPSSTSLNKFIWWSGAEADSLTRTWWFSGSASYTASQGALTGVRFYFESGNISSGSFRLYGIKNS